MIEGLKCFKKYEKFVSKKRVSYKKVLKILDGIVKKAILLKNFSSKNPLESTEKDIKIAMILNK